MVCTRVMTTLLGEATAGTVAERAWEKFGALVNTCIDENEEIRENIRRMSSRSNMTSM